MEPTSKMDDLYCFFFFGVVRCIVWAERLPVPETKGRVIRVDMYVRQKEDLHCVAWSLMHNVVINLFYEDQCDGFPNTNILKFLVGHFVPVLITRSSTESYFVTYNVIVTSLLCLVNDSPSVS
jgi:hypothetical protein